MRRLLGMTLVAILAVVLLRDARVAGLWAGLGPVPALAQTDGGRSAAIGTDPLAMTPAEIAVLQHLSDRRAELERREAALNERAVLLDAVEKRIDERIARLAAFLERQSEASEVRGRRLAKIYQAMRPEDAARLLDTLELGFAAEVLAHMREANAAPILARMENAKARAVTLALADRQSGAGVTEAAASSSGER